MSPGATFERVYRALKDELGSGRFRPGDHLEPAHLSQELNSSITPVRDALHRLVGEGMVEAPRNDGFRVPSLTEVALRHIYAWQQWLLLGATQGSAPFMTDPAISDWPIEGEDELMLRLAALSGNPEHVDAVARLRNRLRPLRKVEGRILEDVAGELHALARAAGEDRSALRKLLTLYHRRRVRAAAEIVAACHA